MYSKLHEAVRRRGHGESEGQLVHLSYDRIELLLVGCRESHVRYRVEDAADDKRVHYAANVALLDPASLVGDASNETSRALGRLANSKNGVCI